METIRNVFFTKCADGSGLIQVDRDYKTLNLLQVRDCAIVYAPDGLLSRIIDHAHNTQYIPLPTKRCIYG